MKYSCLVVMLSVVSLGCGPTAPPAPDAGPLANLADTVTVTVKQTSQDGENIDRASGVRVVQLAISVANAGYPGALGVDPADFFVKTDKNLEVTPTGCGPAVRVAQGGQFECRLTAVMPWSNKAVELVYAPQQESAGGQVLTLPLTVADCTECGTQCRADRHACPPGFIELGPTAAASFAYTATHVYWADYATGEVRRQKLDATLSEPSTLVLTDEPGGGPVAVDQDHVYWVADHLSPTTIVKKAPMAGGAAVSLFDSSALPAAEALTSLAVSGSEAFFVVNTGVAAAAYKVPAAGGTPAKLVELESAQDTFVVDATHGYWVTSAGQLKKVPLAGGMPTVLVPEGVDLVPPAITATHALYVAYDYVTRTQRISAVPLAGGAPRAVVTTSGTINGLAADAQHVYWALYGSNGSVWKVSIAGEEAPLQVGGLPSVNPGMLQLVGGRLFWAMSAGPVAPLSIMPPRLISALNRSY